MTKKTLSSDVYDREYFGSFSKDDYLRQRKGLNHLQPKKGELILDIGCGCGEIVAQCRKLGANAVGLDYSQAAVEISRETVNDGVIIRASATHLPFLDETFDKVVTLDVLEHLSKEDTLKYLSEIRRVLKIGGMLLLHTPSRWEKFREKLLWLPNLIYNLLFPETKFDPSIKQYLELTHINVQSPISLRQLLQKEGFKVKICFSAPKRGEIAFWKVVIYGVLFFTHPLVAIAYKCKRRV